MPVIETQWVDCVGASGGVWNPLTEGLNAAEFENIRARVGLCGLPSSGESFTFTFGLQFSDDGQTWSESPIAEPGAWKYTTGAEGWNFTAFKDWTNLWAVTGTKRLFVRFGVFVKTATAGVTLGVQGKLIVEAARVFAGSLHGGPQRVGGFGAAQGGSVYKLTDWVPAADVIEARFTVNLEALADTIDWAPYAISANDIDDIANWNQTSLASTTSTSSASTIYPTAFLELNSGEPLGDRWVCFGVLIKGSGGAAQSTRGVVRVRVDHR
jgi:hypothetical protein